MRLTSFLFVAFLAATASAQVLPDGGGASCAQDADCGACGWVCSLTSASCVPALSDIGSCTLDAGCACPGQACTGVLGDAGFFCSPSFRPQCLCDGDCSAGSICDARTDDCHPRATSVCTYDEACGCGCFCDGGACDCPSGTCSSGGLCLSNITDGGLIFADAGVVDAGIDAGGVFCQAVGGTCASDSDCCSSNCSDSSCACNQGEDPGVYSCFGDSDCCTPAICDANNTCYLDAGRWVPFFSDGGTTSGSSSGLHCASSGADGSTSLVLLTALLLAARRRRTR